MVMNAVEAVKRLAELTDNKDELLYAAIENGECELAELLLEVGADVNCVDEDGTPVLFVAVENEDEACVKLLLRAGADANFERTRFWPCTALECAARAGNVDIIKILLKAGALLNSCDYCAALKTAVDENHTEAATLLIEAGGNVNTVDGDNFPVLFQAICNSNTKLVKLLIAKGVMLKKGDDFVNAALMWSAYRNCAEITQMFLDVGADVHFRDSHGYTALQTAVENENMAVAKQLVNAGALDVKEEL